MTELCKKIVTTEESAPDNLISGIVPELRATTATLRTGEGILKRGTVLAKSSKDAKLVVLGTTAEDGETLEAYCVLADDTNIAEGDVPASIYISGMFNTNRITVKTDYTMTETDKDTLRKYGIEFKASLTA